MIKDFGGVLAFDVEVGRMGINEPPTREGIDFFYGVDDLCDAIKQIIDNANLCVDDAILIRAMKPISHESLAYLKEHDAYPAWYHYSGEDTPWGDGNVDDEDWGEPDDTYKVSAEDYELLQRVKQGRMPEGEWTGGTYMPEQ